MISSNVENEMFLKFGQVQQNIEKFKYKPKGVNILQIYSKKVDKSITVWYYCGKLDVC